MKTRRVSCSHNLWILKVALIFFKVSFPLSCSVNSDLNLDRLVVNLKNCVRSLTVSKTSHKGVCIDTCHAFAAGYDISSDGGFDKMMQEFESVIGLKYLHAVHLNDSKGELGCHLDRHENIGKGKIGINAFRRLMVDPRFNGIPMILETPCEAETTYQKEVKLLYSFLDGKS
mgnify:CR=1 FL=1